MQVCDLCQSLHGCLALADCHCRRVHLAGGMCINCKQGLTHLSASLRGAHPGPTFTFNKVPEAATGGASLATPAIPAAPQATARPAMPSAVPPATAEISSADKAAVASAQAEATAAGAAVPATPAPSTAAMPAAPAGGPGPVEATAPVAAAEEEELDAAPDSNDNDLMELVEYVLTKIKRPKAGLEQVCAGALACALALAFVRFVVCVRTLSLTKNCTCSPTYTRAFHVPG